MSMRSGTVGVPLMPLPTIEGATSERFFLFWAFRAVGRIDAL